MNLVAYVKLIRPFQWMKNLMLYFPPFLGGAILHHGVLLKGIIPFVSFCCASSATYILNDILDAQYDANHETKKLRPIPSGAISRLNASVLGVVFAGCGIYIASLVSKDFFLLLLLYLAISSLYSMKLKEFVIIDIFCISAGFLLRLEAGGEAFGIVISEWLFLSVFLLAIFLSTGKRVGEKIILGHNAENHRKSLLSYPEGFLEGTMYVTGGAVLVTYTMYVITRHALVYTVPLCTFGILRYILRVKSGVDGDPTESLLKDMQLFMVGLLWVVMIGWGVYGRQ